jgi:hypothetical protein
MIRRIPNSAGPKQELCPMKLDQGEWPSRLMGLDAYRGFILLAMAWGDSPFQR